MDDSNELQDPTALPPAEDVTVHSEQELGMPQERVYMLWKIKYPLSFPGNQTSDYPAYTQ
jgi:hypothetical protein